MQKIIYFTQKGLDEKQKEYDNLLTQRPDAVKELTKAREMGDLSENGYYKSARFHLSDIDRKLRHLKHLLKIARVKKVSLGNSVDIGSTVVISDGFNEKTYDIVGTYESNPANGKISYISPLGKILMGKKQGESAVLSIGDNQTNYKVLKVEGE